MLKPRTPFLVSALLGFLGVVLVAAFKAIFDVTIQDFWKDTAAPFLREHVGAWSATMLEWMGPYSAGLLTAFILVFCVEMIFAWRRSKLASPEPDEDAKAHTDTRLKLRRDASGSGTLLEEGERNIHAWQQIIVGFDFKDEQGGKVGRGFRVDIVALTFSKATIYGRPIIETFGHELEGFSFYALGTRGAVFTFAGGVQAGMIEIWFPPPEYYEKRNAEAVFSVNPPD